MPFAAPARKIFAPQHVAAFKHSAAYKNITAFIMAVNEAVKGKPTTQPAPANEVRAARSGAAGQLQIIFHADRTLCDSDVTLFNAPRRRWRS